MRGMTSFTAALLLFISSASYAAEPPISLAPAVKADGNAWINFADPAGILNVENGITDAEATVFDCFGKLLVTCSKADGRHPSKNHGKTAHVSVWNVKTGQLVWDRKRSRGPDENGDGYPDDQPRNHEDEVEIAVFSPDGRFVAAGGEDDKIEVWRVREDDHTGDQWLSEPVLVQTLTVGDGNPETDDAGIDSMTWSHDGRLLFAGTEQGGKVEIFRTQGEPSTWKFMHKANHGGRPGFAVNSLDLTEDDQYVGTVGTDTKGAFWKLDVKEDNEGLITAVKMIRLATLPSKNGKPIDGSGREARFETNGDRHFIFTLERTGLVQVYDVEQLKAYQGPATEGPAPIAILTNGDKIKDGNEIEPATYSRSGRFLVHDGDTRVNGDSEGIFPGYLRIVETKEIQKNVPMPDPVFVQRIQATEFLDFSPDDSLLASGHGDGTVRLWKVAVSGSETISSEAFNESDPGRWKLSGNMSGTKTGWGSSAQVAHKTAFRGHRGQSYIAARNLSGEVHALEINDAWDIGGFTKRGLQFAAVAAPGAFEKGDFLRITADTNGDGEFETQIVEFLPDADGDLALGGSGGRKLNSVFLDDDGKTPFCTFEDYFVDLEALLPVSFSGKIRFRIEASTDADDEEIGFDSLRVIGLMD
ncbi:WD40 repeat domain-containing protein [Bremerella sp.]|uniref:WD40 repeat domain-containing protein n=1 Tax=Bremerella sp. TaxID=2795602 RepID=UPI00391A0ED3